MTGEQWRSEASESCDGVAPVSVASSVRSCEVEWSPPAMGSQGMKAIPSVSQFGGLAEVFGAADGLPFTRRRAGVADLRGDHQAFGVRVKSFGEEFLVGAEAEAVDGEVADARGRSGHLLGPPLLCDRFRVRRRGGGSEMI
jgi:hypothetical protein